ncbi:MAG TPA: aldehyde dehydrogenase [Gemmatimonadales bacterium]|nr:aldehyde dehydrogenase [Gemmatimonadales bacterium]
MITLLNYVAGALVPASAGKYIEDFEPASGAGLARIPDSDGEDVARAVAAATLAFATWSRTPAAERSRVLLRIADLIEAHQEDLARDESLDTGKPIALARSLDIPRAALNFRFFATAILHGHSEAHPTDHAALNYTLRRPRGVCGLISPWNLPLYLLSWKVAPALAVGNTAVAKPSELAPLTAFRLAELCREAGLPPGVLNIVHGTGAAAGAALVTHDEVRTISFTGGTATGAAIAGATAKQFKKLTLEMGGKNPAVVFADADWEAALPGVLRAAFTNQGQICLCGSRILVEASAYADFMRRFIPAVQALQVGDPLEPDTDIGAVVSAAHRSKIESYLELARADGATIHCGGARPRKLPGRCRDGFFLEPTVISGLPMNCRVNQEEIFGPVVTVTPFTDEAEAVALANQSPYGLAASLWTSNLARAHRVADQIACGTVWVNCWLLRDLRVPFGGMGQSGLGAEGGEEAMRFFTDIKNVCVKL